MSYLGKSITFGSVYTDLGHEVLGDDAVNGVLEELAHGDDHAAEEEKEHGHLKSEQQIKNIACQRFSCSRRCS